MRWCITPVALTLLLVTGCGSTSAIDEIDAAVDATLALTAVDVDASGSTLLSGRPTGSLSVEGTADLADNRHAFTVTSTPSGQDGFTAQVVAAGARVMIKGLPTLEDEWVEVTSAPQAHSADLALFLDPAAVLSLVADLEGDATERGRQMVRGVDTRWLELRLPASRLVRRVEETIELAGPDLLGQVADAGQIEVEGDAGVWIDDDGLVRQVQLRVIGGLGPTQAIPGTGAIDYNLLMSIVPVDSVDAIELPNPTVTTSFGDILSPT